VSFSVSAIIPVYNAEEYVRNAVESALILEDVGEVLLIEDLAEKTAKSLEDRRLGERALQRGLDEYDWRRVIQSLDEVYAEGMG